MTLPLQTAHIARHGCQQRSGAMIEPSLVQPDDRRRPAVPLRMRRLRHAGSRTTTSLGAVLDAVPMLVLLIDERERLTWMNAEAERVLGWRLEELEDRNLLAELLPEPDAYESAIRQVREGSPSWSRLRIRSRGGRRIDCTWRALPSPEGGFAVLLRPNAEHPEETGVGDADRSRQPQKLEAIGRFAGGIAHDFNNLLTAIRCGTELLIEQLPREGSYHKDLEEIQGAASRAATLVTKRLAFRRRQVHQPVALDLKVEITDIGLLLRGIMGEDVENLTVLDPELPPLTAYPAQMEQ